MRTDLVGGWNIWRTQMWLAKYRKWNDAIPQHSSIRILRWQTPTSGWIKCNFDAAWDENGSIGGFGLVVRDADEGFLAVQVGREEGVRSTLYAEAAAARATTLFLCKWSTEQVQVEGDALLVTSAIQNASAAYKSHYRHLFKDTRKLLQELRQWKITFGLRETNKVAHRLARFSLTIDHPVSWFEEPPDAISE